MNLKLFLFASTAVVAGLLCSHDSMVAAQPNQGRNVTPKIASKAATPRPAPVKEPVQQAPKRTVNLKERQQQINTFYEQMVKAGVDKELSQEFKTIYSGMKKGTYDFDSELVKRAMQDLALHARTMRFHSKINNNK